MYPSFTFVSPIVPAMGVSQLGCKISTEIKNKVDAGMQANILIAVFLMASSGSFSINFCAHSWQNVMAFSICFSITFHMPSLTMLQPQCPWWLFVYFNDIELSPQFIPHSRSIYPFPQCHFRLKEEWMWRIFDLYCISYVVHRFIIILGILFTVFI